MRFLITALFMIFIASPALAADEFGERFGQTAPAGLSDPIAASPVADTGFDMDPAALQNIEPAAGDEEMEEPELNSDIQSVIDEADQLDTDIKTNLKNHMAT